MDVDEKAVVLSRASQLRSKINNCIDEATQRKNSEDENSHHLLEEAEAESLLNIRDALESLEEQLGSLQVVSWILERSVQPDLLKRHKQTPLMLAAMHGRISCVQKLIQAGANGRLKIADFGWSVQSTAKRKAMCGTLDYPTGGCYNEHLPTTMSTFLTTMV